MILIENYEKKLITNNKTKRNQLIWYSLIQCNNCKQTRIGQKQNAKTGLPHNHCNNCASKIRQIHRRKTAQDYLNLAKQHNFILLEPAETTEIKATWQCSVGHIWKTTYCCIQQGKGCPFCYRESQLLSKEHYELLAKSKQFQILKIGKNSQEHSLWKCQFGHEWSASYSSVSQNGCPTCYTEIHYKQILDYQTLAIKNGLKFEGKLPKNIKSVCEWICLCGQIIKCSYINIKKEQFYCIFCGLNTHNDNQRIFNEKVNIWRKLIYQLFDYSCLKCKSNKKLNAHHIFNWSSYPELRFDPTNGVCFCKNCHIEFHCKYGNTNNNLEQIKDFVTMNFTIFQNIQNSIMNSEFGYWYNKPPAVS